MKRRSSDWKLVDVEATLRNETAAAWLIFDGRREVWLPKSKVENNNDNTFTMPEWLARDKGLI